MEFAWLKILLTAAAVLVAFVPSSEAGNKRLSNGSKGLSSRDLRGNFGPSDFQRDFYDELALPEIHDQLPVEHRESKEAPKLESKDNKDNTNVARTCADATVSVSSTPSIFDLSSILSSGTEIWGIKAGIVGIAIIIAIIWIKVIVAAFIAWVWWAGYGFGGGKGGGDSGYSYPTTGSSAYGAPSYGPPPTYGAPAQQPSYGAPPQSQYGSPSPAYSSSRSLGGESSFNFETISGYVLTALDALSDLYDSMPTTGEDAKKTA